MKQVTIENVRARIDDLEDIKANTTIGISLREEFELECLRKLFELLALRERAEPVYQMLTGGGWFDISKEHYGGADKTRGVVFRVVYTAPPAPFVPDDDQSRQAYENHVRSRYQYPMLERHPEDGSPWQGEYKESARQMEWEDWQCSWNACRAAMLQPVRAETDTTRQQFESLATSAGSGKHGE